MTKDKVSLYWTLDQVKAIKVLMRELSFVMVQAKLAQPHDATSLQIIAITAWLDRLINDLTDRYFDEEKANPPNGKERQEPLFGGVFAPIPDEGKDVD